MTEAEIVDILASNGGVLGLIIYLWRDSKARQSSLENAIKRLELAFLSRQTFCTEKFASQEDLDDVEKRTRVLETDVASIKMTAAK